jgi:hypothetical protein
MIFEPCEGEKDFKWHMIQCYHIKNTIFNRQREIATYAVLLVFAFDWKIANKLLKRFVLFPIAGSQWLTTVGTRWLGR